MKENVTADDAPGVIAKFDHSIQNLVCAHIILNSLMFLFHPSVQI